MVVRHTTLYLILHFSDWKKKNLSIVFFFLLGSWAKWKQCLFEELPLAATLTDAGPCPWVEQWGDLLLAPHWPILHPLFPWEVKYGLCLLVTFSPVGSRVGLGVWLMPWKTLAGLVSSRRAALAPTPPPSSLPFSDFAVVCHLAVSCPWHRWWVGTAAFLPEWKPEDSCLSVLSLLSC